MKTYQELLETGSYWITKIQNDLYNAVEDYLEEKSMTRAQFAEQLGVSKGYVSQVLNGEFNHRLSKLIELSLAIGKAPVLEFEDLEVLAEKEASGMVRRKASYVPRAPFYLEIKHGEMRKEELLEPTERQQLPERPLAIRGGQEVVRPAAQFFYTIKHELTCEVKV